MPSKDLLEKYKYLTGEDLGHRPSVLEKTKFEYSQLGAILRFWQLVRLITLKRKRIQIRWIAKKTKKQDKYLVYNLQHSFRKFKDIDEFKKLSLESMYKKLNDLKKIIISLKLLIQKQIKMTSWSQKF